MVTQSITRAAFSPNAQSHLSPELTLNTDVPKVTGNPPPNGTFQYVGSCQVFASIFLQMPQVELKAISGHSHNAEAFLTQDLNTSKN